MYQRKSRPSCCEVNERIGYFEYVRQYKIPSTMNHIEITHKLMARKFQRLSSIGKAAMGISLLLCLSFYGYLFFILFTNPITHSSFVEMNKCPACYGVSQCEKFQKGDITLKTWTHLPMLSYFNVKNVYLGQDQSKMVVLKRLARTDELQQVDDEICRRGHLSTGCDPSDAIKHTAGLSGTKWMAEYVRNISDMTACPTERLMERVMDRYREKIDAIQLSAVEKMYLISTLMVNQEPILLQTFPREEGWPFPSYLGACGRMVMVEHGGVPLQEFLYAPFAERVKLAFQLFQLADMFVDNDSQFALYWTDLDADNVMVDSDGELLIVDVENIIVVDRWQIEKDKKPGWDKPYYSQFTPCSESSDSSCLKFSPESLCTSYLADFNYYAICRNFLWKDANNFEGGLLHSMPEEIEDRHEIVKLVEECVNPSAPDKRLAAKDALLAALRNYARHLM